MAKQTESKPLGLGDVIAGAVIFVLLCVLLYEGMSRMVPGLLSFPVLKQVILSGLMFLTFWALLGNSVFVPFFEVLYEREGRTKGDLALAQEKLRQSSELERELGEHLRLARLAGIEIRDKRIELASKKAAEVSNVASKTARAQIESAQAEIGKLKSDAREDLEEEAAKLAKLVVSRALTSAPGQVVH